MANKTIKEEKVKEDKVKEVKILKTKDNENETTSNEIKLPVKSVNDKELTIRELMDYKDACLMLVDFYSQEYKITDGSNKEADIKRNRECIFKKTKYNKKLYELVDKIEKLVDSI